MALRDQCGNLGQDGFDLCKERVEFVVWEKDVCPNGGAPFSAGRDVREDEPRPFAASPSPLYEAKLRELRL
jgi:hypothetical protein